MNIVIIVTGSLVGIAYLTELFIAWYSGVEYEQYAFLNRATGPYWWAYAAMMTCNVITPQLFWFKKIRTKFNSHIYYFYCGKYWYVVRTFCNHCTYALSEHFYHQHGTCITLRLLILEFTWEQ
jgi:hypothetical protein